MSLADQAVDAALEEWRAHEWGPVSRLCACGELFPAIGRETNGHPEHRMRAALEAAFNTDGAAGPDSDDEFEDSLRRKAWPAFHRGIPVSKRITGMTTDREADL